MLSLRRALTDERGLSLLEVMVATSLVLGSLFATVSAMDSGVQAASAAERRVQATALAERDVEYLRSIAYHRIGLERGSPGWTPTFEGADTVAVSSAPFDPTTTVNAAGTTFTITRHVTWADVDTSDGSTVFGGYKRLAVVVSWPGGEGGSVRVDSAVSPYYQSLNCEQRWVDAPSSEVSGVVNAYLPGLAASDAGAYRLQVGPTTGAGSVAAGDVLLVIQMEGPSAGTYEYAVATSSVVDGWLDVTGAGADGGLRHAYGSGGRFQVVRVPNAGDVRIADSVYSLAWNGSVGGVVALDATGNLTFGAPIIGSDAGVRGGALVMVRAGHVAGAGLVISNGQDGGGRVVVDAETGGLDQLTVSARGTAEGAPGGTLLTTSPVANRDVTGFDGSAGTEGTLAPESLEGTPLAAGCLPAVDVDVEADTAQRAIAGGRGSVTYTAVVTNGSMRGTAAPLGVSMRLPSGMELVSSQVQLAGGATRESDDSPKAGDPSPRWATFGVPGGSRVTIVVVVAATPDAAVGPNEVEFRATYSGNGLEGTAAGRAMVLLTQFSCPVPSTDPAPSAPIDGIVNTYFPLTATAAAGATQLSVGPPTGAATELRPGDLVLVSQTLDTDQAREGAYEYATVVAVSGDQVRINGAGVGGGLVDEYRSPAANPSRRAQLIRVPTYPDMRLGSIVAAPWDGGSGGVVAIDVAGTLDLAGGSIGADGAGSTAPMSDEGAVAGAGRSSSGSGGSGGGGGGGAGGRGGGSTGYGNGGTDLPAAIDRAGRGAPGGRVGPQPADASGARGGVVLVRAAGISGVGTISADGGPGLDASADTGGDSGGGGGGGGTVIVSSPLASGDGLTVRARGGRGGDAGAGSGGGGGGGGGIVYVRAQGADVDVAGGAKGASGTGTGARDGSVGVSGTFAVASMPGSPLGVGCQPVPLVGAASETPTVFRTGGQSATWTISAINLNGRQTITGAVLAPRLPPGVALGATPATVTLTGGATRTSSTDPPAGASAPSWGTFDIPGGGAVFVTFTVPISLAAGTYELPTALSGEGPDGPIAAGQPAGDPDSDDLDVLDPTHPTVLASSVDDRTTGTSNVTRFPLDAVDAMTLSTGSFGPSPSADRYLDILQATGLYQSTPTVLPGASLRARIAFAAPADGVAACVYAEVRSASTGALIATVGSDAEPIGCVIGTAQSTFDAMVPGSSWSGAQLDDLRLRLIGWVAGGGALALDRAGLVASWSGADVALQTTAVVDASSGTAAAPVPNPMSGSLGSTRLDLGGVSLSTSFSGSRFAQFAFPAVVPADARVSGGSIALDWSSDVADQVCWFAQIRNGNTVLATRGGSAARPTCRGDASASADADRLLLPALAAGRAGNLNVRIYFRTRDGKAKWIRVDRAELSISWYRP